MNWSCKIFMVCFRDMVHFKEQAFYYEIWCRMLRRCCLQIMERNDMKQNQKMWIVYTKTKKRSEEQWFQNVLWNKWVRKKDERHMHCVGHNVAFSRKIWLYGKSRLKRRIQSGQSKRKRKTTNVWWLFEIIYSNKPKKYSTLTNFNRNFCPNYVMR